MHRQNILLFSNRFLYFIHWLALDWPGFELSDPLSVLQIPARQKFVYWASRHNALASQIGSNDGEATISTHVCAPWSVWPDLANFCHFGKSLQVFGKFSTVYFLFAQMLSLLWQICDIIGLIFIVSNGQILKKSNYLVTMAQTWPHFTDLKFSSKSVIAVEN